MPATRATIHYLPREPRSPERQAALARAAAVEPILARFRGHTSPGLIDASGKIRHVFTKASPGARDTVSQVIAELNRVPEALAAFEAALAARRELDALGRDAVSMPIHDARTLADASLDGNGFLLARHTSAVSDWQDDEQIARIYHAEIEALVKRLTGAIHTFSNNHLRRQSEPESGGDGPLAKLMAQSRGPVSAAHNDFAESYGEGIIRTVASGGVPHTQTFGITQAVMAAGIDEETLRASRLLVVNTWRSVGAAPLRRWPLAIADRRSVPRRSLRRNLIGKVPSGQPRGGIEVYSAHHDPSHRWYYYPEMTPGEVLLWKGYDSAEVPARPPLHTAFDDPASPPGAAERSSIEVRVLCLLPKGAGPLKPSA